MLHIFELKLCYWFQKSKGCAFQLAIEALVSATAYPPAEHLSTISSAKRRAHLTTALQKFPLSAFGAIDFPS